MLWLSGNNRVQKYKKIRKLGRSLNSKIVKVIPRKVIDRTSTDMRIRSKNTLLLDSEADLDFLFDRIIYDVPWDGKGAIEHFEAGSGLGLSAMEEKLLDAMKEAYFSLFAVVGGVSGEFLQLSDLLSDGQIELTDISLSSAASKRFLLATRIIKFEDIFMTSGAGYPFLSEQKDTLISGLKAGQTARIGRKKRATRRIDFSKPSNYSLYFFRQYKKYGTVEMRTSAEL
ncbi:hypothetical protein ACFL6S_15660 [Candidatus Poribacteria bacterium]